MAGELLTAPSEAPVKPAKVHKGRGSPLTHEQLDALVILHRMDKSQTEIAQAIGCDQGTVSRYLQSLKPTGDYAGAYLRANQGLLAEKFVEKAKGSDILDLLGRFEAIPASKDAGKGGLVIQIGVKDSDVAITLSPPLNAGAERKVVESLAIPAGSDKPSYVNGI